MNPRFSNATQPEPGKYLCYWFNIKFSFCMLKPYIKLFVAILILII